MIRLLEAFIDELLGSGLFVLQFGMKGLMTTRTGGCAPFFDRMFRFVGFWGWRRAGVGEFLSGVVAILFRRVFPAVDAGEFFGAVGDGFVADLPVSRAVGFHSGRRKCTHVWVSADNPRLYAP